MDIKYIKDNEGNKFFPLVHEKGVVDNSGTTLETKLSNVYTKPEINNLIVPANTEISVVSELPASGVANTIYRVAGTTNYKDYGWDGTQFVELATYNNLIDDVPITSSDNLISNRGISDAIITQTVSHFKGVEGLSNSGIQNAYKYKYILNADGTVTSSTSTYYIFNYSTVIVPKGTIIQFIGTSTASRTLRLGCTTTNVSTVEDLTTLTIDHVVSETHNGEHNYYYIMPYNGYFVWFYNTQNWETRNWKVWFNNQPDEIPTRDSINPITSGAVYSKLKPIEDIILGEDDVNDNITVPHTQGSIITNDTTYPCYMKAGRQYTVSYGADITSITVYFRTSTDTAVQVYVGSTSSTSSNVTLNSSVASRTITPTEDVYLLKFYASAAQVTSTGDTTVNIAWTSTVLPLEDRLEALEEGGALDPEPTAGSTNGVESRTLRLMSRSMGFNSMYNPSILTKSGYLNGSGTKVSNANYGYSDPIAIEANTKLTVTGVGNGIAIYIETDSEGTFVSAGRFSNGYNNMYSYTFTTATYIRLQGRLDYFVAALGAAESSSSSGGTYKLLSPDNDILFEDGYVTFTHLNISFPDTNGYTVVYADPENQTPVRFNLRATGSPARRGLVLTNTGVIQGVINMGAVKNSDMLLLYWNETYKTYTGGALLPYFNKSRIGTHGEINSDVPENIGVYNAIKKAYQMANVTWAPVASGMPYNSGTFTNGTTYKGTPYSSVKEYSQYIFEDVSLETFMTAVKNPRSVLYTENISSSNSQSALGRTYHGTNCACYYGSVCSALLSYAYGIPHNFTTYEVLTWDKMEVVEDQTAYGLKLGDCMWQQGHVVLITDIKRNSRGVISNIEVIQNAGQKTNKASYTLDGFENYRINGNFTILRYKELWKNKTYVPATEFVAVEEETVTGYTYNTDICPNLGNKCNYSTEDTVILNLRTDYASQGFTTLEVYKDNAEQPIISRAISSYDEQLQNLSYGDYKARIVGSTDSDFTYFKVVDMSVTQTGDSFSFDSENSTPLYYEFVNTAGSRGESETGPRIHMFTQEELTNKSATPTGNTIYRENYQYLKVHFSTDYGRIIKKITWTPQ